MKNIYIIYYRFTISQKSYNQNIFFNQIFCCPKPNSCVFFKYITPYTYVYTVYTITLIILFIFFPIQQYLPLLYTTVYVLGWVYLYIMYRTQAIYAWLLVVCNIGTENVKRRNLHFTRIVDFLYTLIYTLLHPFFIYEHTRT